MCLAFNKSGNRKKKIKIYKKIDRYLNRYF